MANLFKLAPMRKALIYRLIWREVFARTMLVLLAVLSLFILFDALESKNITQLHLGGLRVQLLKIVLELPEKMYELMPLAVLMGSIWALSIFARNGELTIIRVSGMTVNRLLAILAIFGFAMGAFGMFVDEIIDPYIKNTINPIIAKLTHSSIYNNSQKNLWLRYGTQMIHVKSVEANHIQGLTLIKLSSNLDRVLSITKAKSADVITKKLPSNSNTTLPWMLKNGWTRTLPNSIFSKNTLQNLLAAPNNNADIFKKFKEQIWSNAPDIKVFIQENKQSKKLKLKQLWTRYLYNIENSLNNKSIAIITWKKMFYPLVLVVMAIIGVPFCLQTSRLVQTNLRLLIGIIIGIIFFVMQGIFSNLGILALPPIPSIATPLILFTLVTFFGVWWAQRR